MLGLRSMGYELPALIVVVSIVFVFAHVGYMEPRTTVDYIDVLAEGTVAILGLVGIFIVQKMRDFRNVYIPLMFGLTFFYFYALTDVLDEFVNQPDYIRIAAEDVFQVLGVILLALGGWRWIRMRDLTEKVIMESEARHRGLIEASLDAIISMDSKGLVILWNKSAQKMFGYTGEEILGKPVTTLMPDEYVQKHLAGVKRYLDTGVPKMIGGTYEAEGLTKEGRIIPIEISLFEENIENGKSFTGIIRDVTERKKTDKKIQVYMARLEDSNRMKDLFTDILRHDLMNPLGTIKSAAELILPASEESKIIVSNSERLIEIINMASQLGKLETMESLEKQNMDLGEMLQNVIRDYDSALKERGQEVVLEANGQFETEVNPLVGQVFTNLLSNAVKYSPHNTTITVSIEDENGSWRITVADQCGGIKQEDRDKLFTRFKRVKKEGVKGTGLGLAIAKRIVELHGGEIWLDNSKDERGCAFNVRLPKK